MFFGMTVGTIAPRQAWFGLSPLSAVPSSVSRLSLIDALKAVASQIIVLHHLAFYGPMSDVARTLAPTLIDGLSSYGRWAVQVFLVIGGFLAARSLAPNGTASTGLRLIPLLWRRYLRLVLPLAAVLLLAIAASAIASHWMDHDSIPERARPLQFLAHLLLLQGVTGVDSLSAGMWYVAIDFQLFALFALSLWIASKAPARWRTVATLTLISAFALAALMYFNTRPDWDNWGVYFFGSYALGALSFWGAQPGRRHWAMLIYSATLLALVLTFRERLLALAVAVVLWLDQLGGGMQRWGNARWLTRLASVSYSVFLVHFPVLLLVNGAFTAFLPATPAVQAFGMALAWAASLLAGSLFYRWVEAPSGRWLADRKPTGSSRDTRVHDLVSLSRPVAREGADAR